MGTSESFAEGRHIARKGVGTEEKRDRAAGPKEKATVVSRGDDGERCEEAVSTGTVGGVVAEWARWGGIKSDCDVAGTVVELFIEMGKSQ